MTGDAKADWEMTLDDLAIDQTPDWIANVEYDWTTEVAIDQVSDCADTWANEGLTCGPIRGCHVVASFWPNFFYLMHNDHRQN